MTVFFIVVFAFCPFLIFGQAEANSKSCIPCEKLKELRLPDVTISRAESMAKETIESPTPWMPPYVVNVPFCKVSGTISKEIGFELLLPQTWNGRFLMSGGGGFVGSIQNDLIKYVDSGYVTVGTNTGHSGTPISAEWALNNM